MNAALEKMKHAVSSLILDQPFFASLILKLQLIEDKTCQTMKTNGAYVKYNPAFVMTLPHEHVVGVLAHEVMHCASGHPWRRDARDPELWNIATDKTINNELRESKFSLPEGTIYAEGDEVGKSAEWIYTRLQQQAADDEDAQQPPPQPQQQQQPQAGGAGEGEEEGEDSEDTDQEGEGEGEAEGDGEGDGETEGEGEGDAQNGGGGSSPNPCGEVEDAPTEEDADGNPPPTEQDWKDALQSAITQATLRGDMPGGLKRRAAEALRPRIDLKSLLLRFFQERSAADYSWTRPNPRYISQRLYLPALHSQSLGEVAVMVDTSGSIDEISLQYARGILEQVIDECDPAGVTLYFVDTQVANVQRMEKGDPLTWEPGGGGGTDFRSFFDDVEKGEIEPACVVCITDLEAVFPEKTPNVPVLWLSTVQRNVAPFGETVFIDR